MERIDGEGRGGRGGLLLLSARGLHLSTSNSSSGSSPEHPLELKLATASTWSLEPSRSCRCLGSVGSALRTRVAEQQRCTEAASALMAPLLGNFYTPPAAAAHTSTSIHPLDYNGEQPRGSW